MTPESDAHTMVHSDRPVSDLIFELAANSQESGSSPRDQAANPSGQARRHWLKASTAGALAVASPWSWAQTVPLLIEGKKTLYQKILTRPGAALSTTAGGAPGKVLAPFAVYFVYHRVQAAGQTWLHVGASPTGRTDGFLPETDTVPWRHMITLAFASPTTRERVLFFRDRQALATFSDGANPSAESSRILKEIDNKPDLGRDHPVIAAEPPTYVDLQKNFYLLPVLDAQSTLLKSGHRARFVKVASVTSTEASRGGAGIENFNSAVVFVIDATSSMQPYIDRARQAMDEVLRQADAAKLSERIHFGAIAFQDDPAKAKGMDYLVRTFADPTQYKGRQEFLASLQGIRATPNSTRAFAEDAYAGLDEAIRKVNWTRYGGRYIVFITDASAREGNSALASTRLDTQQMRAYAQERGVAIWAVHLKTPEGKADHAMAEAQYRRLTQWPGAPQLYFGIEAGNPDQFQAQIKLMAQALVDQVANPKRLLQGSAGAQGAPTAANGADVKAGLDAVGRAMVLSYLGRQEGVKSPPMYEAWAMDRDFRNREIASFSVRVLLTKNQLSDLQALSRKLSEAYERAQLDPKRFFEELRSAAAALGRDPSQLAQGKARNLEQAGLMAEYLEGLPYQSQIMSMDFDAWKNMSVGQQQELVDRLKSLVALYQRFHDDVDRWVALHSTATDGERVYPVPIDALP
jgi:serine/threonine-protein kinase PpkA